MKDNPLLEHWQNTFGVDASYNEMHRLVSRNFSLEHFTRSYKARDKGIELWSFAVPSEEALQLIASYGPVVEIGAGTGYWAQMLSARGCDVLAYDNYEGAFNQTIGIYSSVFKDNTYAARKHPDRTLLLVWPPYKSSMAAAALSFYEMGGGQRLVYVGESEGGCTADDEFFQMVSECWRCNNPEESPCTHRVPTWHQVEELAIPQWDGIHDYLTVYERKPWTK